MMASEKRVPAIDEDVCSGCGICVDACSQHALQILEHVAILRNPEACCGSEACVAACPVTAIEMRRIPCRGGTR